MAKFLTQYDPSVKVKLICTPEEGRTKPEFAKDCDLNLILAKYKKTGVLPDSARIAAMRFGDFSGVPDYQEMRNRVLAAEELFGALPSKVREQFRNDPAAFLAAAETPEGVELLSKLGLGKPKPPEDDPERVKRSKDPARANPSEDGVGVGSKAPKASSKSVKTD